MLRGKMLEEDRIPLRTHYLMLKSRNTEKIKWKSYYLPKPQVLPWKHAIIPIIIGFSNKKLNLQIKHDIPQVLDMELNNWFEHLIKLLSALEVTKEKEETKNCY